MPMSRETSGQGGLGQPMDQKEMKMAEQTSDGHIRGTKGLAIFDQDVARHVHTGTDAELGKDQGAGKRESLMRLMSYAMYT